MKKYLIKRHREVKGQGTIEEVLTTNKMGILEFCICSNNAVFKSSAKIASEYFNYHAEKIKGLLGCRVFIEGPNGGVYSVNKGELKK